MRAFRSHDPLSQQKFRPLRMVLQNCEFSPNGKDSSITLACRTTRPVSNRERLRAAVHWMCGSCATLHVTRVLKRSPGGGVPPECVHVSCLIASRRGALAIARRRGTRAAIDLSYWHKSSTPTEISFSVGGAQLRGVFGSGTDQPSGQSGRYRQFSCRYECWRVLPTCRWACSSA